MSNTTKRIIEPINASFKEVANHLINFKVDKENNKIDINDLKNKIICRDCIKGISKLPDATIDIIIADPPYNIGKDFGNDSDKQNHNDYIEWTKKWINECKRVLKPTGTMFIYGFDEILAHISVLLPLNKQRWLTWYYTNKNVASLNFWQRSHESIICYWINTPIFNRDDIREPYTESFLNGSAGRIRPASSTGRGGHLFIVKIVKK